MTDETLYELCRHYGKQALEWRNKFAGLLPEVERRKLYKKKGFGSIFEFAFKLAGLSEAQVKLALSLDQKFSDKPVLRELLVSGKASVNKLVRVASVATIENQKFLAKQVETLPNRALETFVRDIKFLHVQKTEKQNRLFENKMEELKLSDQVVGKLVELQNKGLDINEMILEFLKTREEKIENEKDEISANSALATAKKTPRYIPAKTRHLLKAEHGTKCAIAHCQKPAKTIHHTARFALSQSHNPHYLAPLCREHHLIAHTVDQKFLIAR
ncbi:MAG: hypothetical protein WC901_08510 [Candidatus Margulisiibacteriota bacterium]